MPNQQRHLLPIQYLRAIAAIMVVIHHARNPREWLFNPLEDFHTLAWGVDVFFVISGFIMYVAARNQNHFDFIKKRIIRVAPLYWLATLLLLAINTNLHIWWIDGDTLIHIIKSLFFIPDYNLYKPTEIWPYLIPGWTLNYEMFFYLLFFIGLFLGRTIEITTISILLLILIGVLIDPSSILLSTYTNPILLEFLCGIWAGKLYVNGKLNSKYYGTLILAIGFIILFLTPEILSPNTNILGRTLASTLIIVGAACISKQAPKVKWLDLLGNASYSIYLTHTLIALPLSTTVWKNLEVDGWLQFACWITFSTIASCIVGVVIHLLVEKPLTKKLNTYFSS